MDDKKQKNSLININFDGMGEAVAKFLDLLRDLGAYAVLPKGSAKDLNDAVELYKKEVENDNSISPERKGLLIASYRKELKEHINKTKILQFAFADISSESDLNSIDNDWLDDYFEKAGKITNEDVQRIWGKLLAEKCNGNHMINKRLVNILFLMEKDVAIYLQSIFAMTIGYHSCPNGDWIEQEPVDIWYERMEYIPLVSETGEIGLSSPLRGRDFINDRKLWELESLGVIKKENLVLTRYRCLGGCFVVGDLAYRIYDDQKTPMLGRANFEKGLFDRLALNDEINISSYQFTHLGDTLRKLMTIELDTSGLYHDINKISNMLGYSEKNIKKLKVIKHKMVGK